MKKTSLRSVSAFGPATIANVGVGFDVLGLALEGMGDRVWVSERAGSRQVEIEGVSGAGIPQDPARNTAAVALTAMIEGLGLRKGFVIRIEKGIPLGSGLGGSAASAVAAVVAARKLLGRKIPDLELLKYALAGEGVASGSAHADNVAPCLLGGLTAVISNEPLDVVRVPVFPRLLCVVVHPHVVVETRAARGLLKREILLSEHVRQSAALAGVLAAFYGRDRSLLQRSMVDWIVGPQRAALIPGFEVARAAALRAGAWCFAISGSGPSVFAWTESPVRARRIEREVRAAFHSVGVESDGLISPVARRGAR